MIVWLPIHWSCIIQSYQYTCIYFDEFKITTDKLIITQYCLQLCLECLLCQSGKKTAIAKMKQQQQQQQTNKTCIKWPKTST